MGRPQSILWFERCYLGSLGLGVLNSVLNWSKVQATIDATPGAAALPQGFMIVTMAVSLAISLLLWYFAARRGFVAAKWIIVAFFAISLIGIARALLMGAVAPTMNIFYYLAFALHAAAVWMLFRPDARAWFAGSRADDLTNTFS